MTTSNMTAVPVQAHPPRKKVHVGLRSPNLFARRPIIGIIMFIFGVLVFGGLAYNLRINGPLITWDMTLKNTLPAIAKNSAPFVKIIMNAAFYIGDQVLVGAGILLGLYFLFKHYWQEMTMVAIGLAGATLLFYLLSMLFARPRPDTQMWIIVNLPGFPSGHAVSAPTFYGFLAYVLVPKMRAVFWKVVVIVATVLLVCFIGFSRIFTGGHYLTDVLAGYAVGIAWSGAVYTTLELIFQRIRSHHAAKE
jgi:membrane-associated phospholipid phosphatase